MRQLISIFLISTLILLSIMDCANNKKNKREDSKENILIIENILGVGTLFPVTMQRILNFRKKVMEL